MSTPIKNEDIQYGDLIKVTNRLDGVLTERTGKVWSVSDVAIRTEADGYIWNSGWAGNPVFELLDRPKPPLPTKTGSLIIADDTFGRGATVVLRDGRWEYLQGGIYDLNQLKVWKLAKVVEA